MIRPPSAGPSLISCSQLTKRYGRKTVFSGLDLDIPAGGVCALLGRNGAGKTTLLRLALGLGRPTGGHVSLLGSRPGSANSRVGLMSENVAVYPHLSAVDNLRVAFNSAGVRPPAARGVLELLERVSLSGAGRKVAGGFSLGMKRRLQLAMTTMVRPVDLLLLDEPTNGLDIDGVAWLKEFVAAAPARGTSVIMSSHDLGTLQSLLSHVSILHEGSVVVNEPWESAASRSGRVRVWVEPAEVGTASATLRRLGEVRVGGEVGELELAAPTEARDVLRALYASGVLPTRVERVERSLEEMFVAATGGPR